MTRRADVATSTPPLSAALDRIRAVLEANEPRHRGTWRTQSVSEHVEHAINHLVAYHVSKDRSEPHLDHAACRIMFALELTAADD